jgi:hypothetical protein
LGSYEKSYKVVTTHLGEDNPLVKSLYESYVEAKHKAEEYVFPLPPRQHHTTLHRTAPGWNHTFFFSRRHNEKQDAQAKRAAKFAAVRGPMVKGSTAIHTLTHRELEMLSSHDGGRQEAIN